MNMLGIKIFNIKCFALRPVIIRFSKKIELINLLGLWLW